MLKVSARRATILTTLLGIFLRFSIHPILAGLGQQRKAINCPSPLLIIASIFLLLGCHNTLATDDHAHRHHHPQARLHGITRSYPEKSDEEISLPILNRCSESHYPDQWKAFMEALDKEQDMLETRIMLDKSSKEFEQKLQQFSDQLGEKGSASTVAVKDEDKDKDGGVVVDMMSMKKVDVTTNEWQPSRKLLGGINQRAGRFRLLDKEFDCTEKNSKTLHWHSIGTRKQLKEYNFSASSTSIILSNLSLMAVDGKLVWRRSKWDLDVYEKSDFCVWKHGSEWATFKVCYPDCSDHSPCIRKCCPPWEITDEKTRGCKEATPEWRPTFYRTAGDMEVHDRDGANAKFVYGFPNCQKRYIINESPKNNFKLLLNGTLVQIEQDAAHKTYIKPGEFCIDGLYYGGSKSKEGLFQGSEWDQIVIACTPNTFRMWIEDIRLKVYAGLNGLSALFLLLTDAVYILIARYQNNLHSWLQFSYATSLFFTFACFAIGQLWSTELRDISWSLCAIMGWLTHLTYLSAFFWLTSMNFDLWWRFSRPLRSTRIQTQGKKRRRFLGFAAFSIVIPLMISGIGIALDYKYYETLLDPPITVPGFGKEKCYFESKKSQIPYLYFPAGVLLIVDFVFFASTVLHLKRMHTHTELARTQSTSTMEDKKGVRVIAKLFIVMGVLWVFELFSWILRLIFTDPDQELTLVLLLTPIDCLNSIQGVFIFFIFICKPAVKNQLLALFRRDDSGKIWNKQLPSESTLQQPANK